MIADIHYRYLSTIITPNFLQGILLYEKLSKSTITKIIDTTTVINHKLYDLIQTGFIEGTLIIPKIVITDLYNFNNHFSQKIKRRGTRGLLVLNKLKKVYDNQILVDFFLDDLSMPKGNCLFLRSNESVDPNISYFTKSNTIILNELIKATRIPYLYGEVFSLRVIRKGNRLGQGIGYLEDGTMVIVEKGYQYIGQRITVNLKKVWQRSSGTILFTCPQSLILSARIRKRKEKKGIDKKSNF
jgi:uncharacterized protein YacL